MTFVWHCVDTEFLYNIIDIHSS